MEQEIVYFVPDRYPECCECGEAASVVTFTSMQTFIATLTTEGIPDDNHCEPIGLPEKLGGDDLYYCDACKPTG